MAQDTASALPPTSLGAKLRQLRMAHRWSLGELAAQIGSSKSHLSALENGHTAEPSVGLLQRLATFHGVSVEFLINPMLTQPDSLADRDFIEQYRQQPAKIRAEVRDYFAAKTTVGRRLGRLTKVSP